MTDGQRGPRARLQWRGHVIQCEGDIFTAELYRDGCPDLEADFSMAECGLTGVQPGNVIIVTDRRVRVLSLGNWTQAELDEINERARKQEESLRDLID